MKLLDEYLKYCEPLKGSVLYHKWSMLSTISALLERRVYLDQGRVGVLFPNTYIFLVGPPATGKGFSIDLAHDFYSSIRGVPMPAKGPTKITSAALYEHLAKSLRPVTIPGRKQYFTSPMYLVAGELAQAAEDFGGGTLTNELIDFYDSKGVDAEVKKFTLSGGYIVLRNPSLALLAGTQAEFLQTAQQARIVNSGLASRVLFVVETGLVEKQYRTVAIDDVLRKSILSQLDAVYRFKGVMNLTLDAREEYIIQGEKAHAASIDSLATFYKNYYGRKPMHILKLAMIIAGSRQSLVVTKEDITEAVGLIEEIEPLMVHAFGTRSIDRDVDLAMQLINTTPEEPRWITRGVMLGGLFAGGKFVAEGAIFETTLKSLVTSGIIKSKFLCGVEHFTRGKNYLQRLLASGIIAKREQALEVSAEALQQDDKSSGDTTPPSSDPNAGT